MGDAAALISNGFLGVDVRGNMRAPTQCGRWKLEGRCVGGIAVGHESGIVVRMEARKGREDMVFDVRGIGI